MDGSSNPYLLQSGILAAGIYGLNNKSDPGEPLTCNMYTDYKNYPNLEKLPNDLEEALNELDNSKNLREAYGENVINSYLKLKKQELDTFYKVENFDKKKSVTEWEKSNSLDC